MYDAQMSEYESGLTKLAQEKYDEIQSVGYVYPSFDGENLWTLCIIVEGDGVVSIAVPFDTGNEVILLTVQRYEKIGETAFWEHSPDVAPGEYVEYAVVDKLSDVPRDAADKAKIKINGETMYFYIKMPK